MPRPRKCRNVCCLPEYSRFGPFGSTPGTEPGIIMSVDEYETIRLIDLEELTQEECAARMNVARTTVQFIYNDARKKLALSLVNGKVLRIEGGDYKLCDGKDRYCRKERCGRCGCENGQTERSTIVKDNVNMDDNKAHRFENPIRLAELDPENTLIKAGLKKNMTLCDIGAGTGVFSFPAARISGKDVYAVEIDDRMIERMKIKKQEKNIPNLTILKGAADSLPLESGICDMAVMVTVFHELEDKGSMLKEIRRVLSKTGRLLVIEFHGFQTPMGPPAEYRISAERMKSVGIDNGYKVLDEFVCGDNLYGIVFE